MTFPSDLGPDGTLAHPDDLSEEAIRERVIRLAFDGDRERYERFLDALRDVIPPGVQVVLRGSAVTGRRWADGQPFDADGPRSSDLDITLVGGGMPKLFSEFYIPGVHTVPLSEAHPEASHVFQPLRRALCALTGRAVNIQATTDLVQQVRDLLLDQPYFVMLADGEGRGPTRDTSATDAETLPIEDEPGDPSA